MALLSTVVAGIYGIVVTAWVLLGYVVWQERDQAGATSLLGVVVGAGWWSAVLFLASQTESFTISMWLQRSTYFGVSITVVFIFLFALEYTGRQHLITPWTIGLLAIHPVSEAFVVVANPGNLFFSTIQRSPASVTGVTFEFGPVYWVYALYSYVLLAVALFLLFRALYRTERRYRFQFVLLFVSIVGTTILNFAYIAGPIPFDPTPIGLLFAAALVTTAITRYSLINIVPIARDQVLDSINDAVFVVDEENHLVDANTAGRALLQQETDDENLVGTGPETFFDAIPEAEDIYRELTETIDESQIEIENDGFWFDITSTPIKDPRGEHVGWLFIVRDVTERKRREEEIRRRNEQLDEFAGVVSHDLRNPLSVARGYVQLAYDTNDLSHLEEVETAHERMGTIIDDVLTLAREGDAVTEPEVVSLRAAAEDAWSNVDTAGAELDADGSAAILADRNRLVRIFENLFRNAVKHGIEDSPSGSNEPMTRGASETSTDGGDTPRPALAVDVGVSESGFYVADDGVGIPEADRETVFESGYTTAADGVGTGLDIVRQLAEAHGWTVTVTDSATGGARFEFDDVDVSLE